MFDTILVTLGFLVPHLGLLGGGNNVYATLKEKEVFNMNMINVRIHWLCFYSGVLLLPSIPVDVHYIWILSCDVVFPPGFSKEMLPRTTFRVLDTNIALIKYLQEKGCDVRPVLLGSFERSV